MCDQTPLSTGRGKDAPAPFENPHPPTLVACRQQLQAPTANHSFSTPGAVLVFQGVPLASISSPKRRAPVSRIGHLSRTAALANPWKFRLSPKVRHPAQVCRLKESIKNCRVALDKRVVLVYTLVMNESSLHYLLIQHISKQMCLAKLNEIEPYHLCWYRGFLEVHYAGHMLIRHPIFHTFSPKQTCHGCSHTELVKITTNISNFFKENPQCLKQFKL